MLYYGMDNKEYLLTDQIGAGGEGFVYEVQGNSNIVAKIFKKINSETILKIKLLSQFHFSDIINKSVTLPITALFSDKEHFGDCAGFIMNKLVCKEMLLDVYNQPDDRISIYNQAYLALDLSRIVDEIHKSGYINDHYSILIGDFNPKNIFVDRKNGNIQITDSDSFHIRVNYQGRVRTLRCGVLWKDMFIIPELLKICREQNANLTTAQGETFTVYTDRFLLAYHIHKLLLGVDPYGRPKSISKYSSSSVSAPPTNAMAIGGNYIYTNVLNGYQIPNRYPDFDVLTPTLQELFRRAFQYGASDPEVRPTAKEFSDALEDYIESLEYCECSGWDHYLRKDYNKPYCEWCRVEHEYGQKRKFYPKNIPYMNDNELEYCMKIDLSDHYKTLIRKELKKRRK